MRRCLFILTIFLFAGCKNDADGVIAKDKMTSLLWDMIQADEISNTRVVKDPHGDIKKTRIQLYQKVFELHQVSEKQFSKSFNYYSGHPDLLKELFDTLEAKGRILRQEPIVKKDSTAK